MQTTAPTIEQYSITKTCCVLAIGVDIFVVEQHLHFFKFFVFQRRLN